jgi:phosphoketolase
VRPAAQNEIKGPPIIRALKYVPRLGSRASDVIDMFNRKLYEHHDYNRQHLEDMGKIRN